MQALHKRGVSANRARRACVATRNASREAALAWCVEHAADAAMDAPFVPPRRPVRRGGPQSANNVGGVTPGGGDGGGDEVGPRDVEARSVACLHRMASAALEAYVRARLSVIRDSVDGVSSEGVGGGGGEVGVPSEEVEVGELVSVLTSFRQRRTLGEAENRARALLPSGVDLERFARDPGYRQVGGTTFGGTEVGFGVIFGSRVFVVFGCSVIAACLFGAACWFGEFFFCAGWLLRAHWGDALHKRRGACAGTLVSSIQFYFVLCGMW